MAKNYFKKSIKNKGFVIENPIPTNLPKPYTGERKKRICCIGRLVEQKNFHLMINAFNKINEKHKEFVLEIYGEGPLELSLKKQVNELDLNDYVIFRGFSKNIYSDVIDSYAYVSTSNYEGISNTMIEAISMGIPTICTDCPIGGARQMIINDINGILVPVNDEKSLVDALLKLIDDPLFAKKLSDNYYILYEKYSIDIIGNKWIKLLDNCSNFK